jgi:hypothetical protein
MLEKVGLRLGLRAARSAIQKFAAELGLGLDSSFSTPTFRARVTKLGSIEQLSEKEVHKRYT